MKCIFYRKNKKNIISLSSAEFAYRVITVKYMYKMSIFGINTSDSVRKYIQSTLVIPK